MALFGFNKAKVLASAEKYVQQGKLNNAIAEYEKIIAKDAKDLTVLNTIGDLYARVGQSEKASEFYRKVGDTYASDGFTVKAIAMYKKLTKLNPGAISVVQRLAELYTQQGLYNDARQQYLVLADNYIKNNDVPNATRIFQKMLEMDPDNVSLQSKLADLYIKAGKKAEAREIYLHAATSLYERGSIDQANHALDRMLELDPSHTEALLMRGKIALNANKGADAAKYFEKIADIDQRPDGLQSLLRAYILSNDGVHAEGVARKLATVHNDLGGVRAFAEFLITGSQPEAALKLYDEFVDRLVVGDSGELTFALQGLSGQIKERPESLEKLRTILQRAGATANIPEVNELLAHAYVKAGKLAEARDLYKELAELEPSNPQHMQNYRQVLSRMGEDPAARPLDAGEGAQALFVEEIVDTPLPPTPDYPAALMEKISNVLTDAELFESYNKPQQAVAPLESILEVAPRDVRINQRLLSVYSKLERVADAAKCCDVLHSVYSEAGMSQEAQQYAEMAAQLRHQAGGSVSIAATTPALRASAPVETFDVVAQPAEAPVAPGGEGEAHEIDLSSEWESAVEEVSPSALGSAAQHFEVKAAPREHETNPTVVSDLLEEITFYISQGMWDEARSAFARCERIAPDNPELAALKQRLETAGGEPPQVAPEMPVAPPQVEAATDEASVMEYDFQSATAALVETAEASVPPAFEVAAPIAEKSEEEFAVPSTPQIDVVAAEDIVEEEPATENVQEVSFEEVEEVAVQLAQPEASGLETTVAAEEPSTEKIIREPEGESEASSVNAEPALEEVAQEKDVLTDLVLDLESSLPDDFGTPAKVIPLPEPAPIAAAAVAASTGGAPTSFVPDAVAVSSVIPQMAASSAPAAVAAPEANTMLSDLFEEFKEDVGEAVEEREDPDTHYNLGVAFKEMGLLDEAIGELQKVCKAIDNGAQFSQVMQAYTWLANCFVEKGVPEASVKWYEKALTIAHSEESRTALHYDLANAFEAAGDRSQALKHFTEVYGTNIDYRDVAERIKALKS